MLPKHRYTDTNTSTLTHSQEESVSETHKSSHSSVPCPLHTNMNKTKWDSASLSFPFYPYLSLTGDTSHSWLGIYSNSCPCSLVKLFLDGQIELNPTLAIEKFIAKCFLTQPTLSIFALVIQHHPQTPTFPHINPLPIHPYTYPYIPPITSSHFPSVQACVRKLWTYCELWMGHSA